MNAHKFVVTAQNVGIIVDATVENAVTEIKKARELLARLAGLDRTTRAATHVPPAKARSLSERVLTLGPEFFSQPRDSNEIAKQLARAGFHYAPVRVRDELLRMVKRGQLRRMGEGTKSAPYRYVNP